MNYNTKDVFLERATANQTFEEYPLRIQPNSVVVTDAYGNLAMVPASSFGSGSTFNGSNAATIDMNGNAQFATVIAGNFTGSLHGTASAAISSSCLSGSALVGKITSSLLAYAGNLIPSSSAQGAYIIGFIPIQIGGTEVYIPYYGIPH
jgi:hypothetical protein